MGGCFLPLQGIILVSPKAGFRKPLLPVAKLAKEIGGAKAAKELGIPEGTIHTWLKAVRAGKLDIGEGSHTPTSAMSLSEEITILRKRVKEQDKEIRRLKEENEFLEKASAFFAASRRKYPQGMILDVITSRNHQMTRSTKNFSIRTTPDVSFICAIGALFWLGILIWGSWSEPENFYSKRYLMIIIPLSII